MEIDHTLYNNELFSEVREDNISFRWSQCNQEFEFVKWFKNKRINSQVKLDEYCIVIAFLDLDERSEPTIRIVGSRVFDLTPDEFDAFSRVGLEIWDRYKELRLDKFKKFISMAKRFKKDEEDE